MAKAKVINCFSVIESTARELFVANGAPGICDHCATPAPRGYYVAVLNRWLCDDCFEEWVNDAEYYPEDTDIEQRNFNFYAPLFGLKC